MVASLILSPVSCSRFPTANANWKSYEEKNSEELMRHPIQIGTLQCNHNHACFNIFELLFSSTYFSSVQLLGCFWLFATPWTAARQASLSITNCQTLPKLMSIESVIPPNHLILCHPLLLLPSIFPSITVFSNELALHIRWPKYWNFSFNISPSNEYLGLISFRMDWLDLIAVQGILKSLLQHHITGEKIYILTGKSDFKIMKSKLPVKSM